MENEGESDLLQDHPGLQLTAAVLLKDHQIWEPLLLLCICHNALITGHVKPG